MACLSHTLIKKNKMEDKFLIEIQRIKKVMLLESGPGTVLRGMVMSFTGNINIGKILQELRDVNALDDATLTQLSNLTGDSFFDELINKIKNLQSSGVGLDSKYLKSLEVLLENAGKKDKFDDVIEKIKTLSDPIERKQAIDLFVGNFNDPTLQNMFKTSLKEIDDDLHRAVNPSTLKGKVLGRGKNVSWDNLETGLSLNKVQRALLQQKYPMSLLIEDLYHWSQGLMNVFSRSLSKEDKINKLIDDVYSRLLNVVNDLEPNMKDADVKKQMAKIWADVNKIRIYGKGEISNNDKNWNSDLFKMFLKSAESKGVSYEIRDALRKGYDENNPLTRPTWWDNLVKKSKMYEILNEYLGQSLAKFTKFIGKLTYQVLSRLLTYVSTGLTISPKEVREIFYKYGRKEGYKYIAKKSLLMSQLILPLIVSVFALGYRFISGLWDKTENNPERYKKDLERIWLGQWKSLWDEGGIGKLVYGIIKKVLFPFKNLWPQIGNWFYERWVNIKNVSLGTLEELSSVIVNLIKSFGNMESEIKNRTTNPKPSITPKPTPTPYVYPKPKQEY
jgi:hypothetical protein